MRNPSSLGPREAHRLAFLLAFQLPSHPFLTPSPYQQLLLEAFVRGELTMDQVLVHLEAYEYAPKEQSVIYVA
ncbi:hypothetical protein [Hymenobacter radiodurans]|uniref:hypothetical protein n=1 Tax=Hymenobacter radiodurans TaxID=2496028 RepID=UPI0010590555|nr:hypothetical protein [Hymenobacter radiodurans]